MLPRVDTNIRPIASIEAPSAVASLGVTKHEVASRLDQLTLGKHLQGEILSRLPDGTFFVKLAGATARMALPQNTQVGDSIPLTLIALTPRPTFLLETGQHNTTTTAIFSRQGLIENFLQGTKTTPPTISDKGAVVDLSEAYVLETAQSKASAISSGKESSGTANAAVSDQDPAINSTPTNLSDTGKLINKILLHTQQEGIPSSLLSKTVLLQSANELQHPEKLANHLQQAIASSGLFYESHVADWAQGKLPLAALMREPQAQLGNAANLLAANPAPLDDHSAMAQIIHLQLDTLEQQRVNWQGELLPGVPFKWEIEQNHHSSPESFSEDEQSWQSVVRFELPHLGVVAATINLHGGQLQLFLRSDTDGTVDLLKDHSATLSEAINRSGAALDFLSIKRDEQA